MLKKTKNARLTKCSNVEKASLSANKSYAITLGARRGLDVPEPFVIFQGNTNSVTPPPSGQNPENRLETEGGSLTMSHSNPQIFRLRRSENPFKIAF